MDKRPNIILLMADQMRGDCLGIAGHPDVKTPFLDALAAEGVRYENAYSACPTCVPARGLRCIPACLRSTPAASGMRILCRGIIPTHWPGS